MVYLSVMITSSTIHTPRWNVQWFWKLGQIPVDAGDHAIDTDIRYKVPSYMYLAYLHVGSYDVGTDMYVGMYVGI